MTSYAQTFISQGSFKEANDQLNSALFINKKIYGNNHPTNFVILYSLSTVLSYQDKINESSELMDEVIRISNNNSSDKINNEPFILHALGSMYKNQGNYMLAKESYESSLKLNQRKNINDIIFYIDTLTNLGLVFYEISDFETAKEHHIEAIEIAKAHLGTNNSKFGRLYNNLCHTLIALEDYDQAYIYCKDAISIIESAYGTKHQSYASALVNFASILFEKNDIDQAILKVEQALEIDRSIYGNIHTEVATDLDILAGYYFQLDSFDKARACIHEAKAIKAHILPQNHPDLAKTNGILAYILYNEGLVDEAIDLATSSIDFLEQSGSNKPFTANLKVILSAIQDKKPIYEYFKSKGINFSNRFLQEKSGFIDKIEDSNLTPIQKFIQILQDSIVTSKGSFILSESYVIGNKWIKRQTKKAGKGFLYITPESYYYIPVKKRDKDLPPELKELIDSYNKENEFIVVVEINESGESVFYYSKRQFLF